LLHQELEKFKFVLDYKIKELKKQIEPRELEIADMKEQIKEMDHELERYHKNNALLDLTISDLKLKLDGIQKETLVQRKANQVGQVTAVPPYIYDVAQGSFHHQLPQAQAGPHPEGVARAEAPYTPLHEGAFTSKPPYFTYQ
jgi:uncharacterized protein (DUF3084 family)